MITFRLLKCSKTLPKGFLKSTLEIVSLFVVSLVAFSRCSTSAVNIQSNPAGADIFLTPVGKGEAKLLGKTPLILPGSELETENGGSGPIMIELKKEGYMPVRTVVTELQSIDLLLNIDLESVTGVDDQSKLNSALDFVFEGQHLARAGQYNAALQKLKAAEIEMPKLAAIFEIEGGIYYLQKKYQESLNAYYTAIKYSPKNLESIRMRNMLEISLGIKVSQPPAVEVQPESSTGAPGAPQTTKSQPGSPVGNGGQSNPGGSN